MNLARFLQHWSIAENPFCGEEARHDAVFGRIQGEHATSNGVAHHHGGPARHGDYEKIRGDFARPASAIVFGEKGSGKTAIRLQLARELTEFNKANPGAACLLIAYDDLNPVLDRFHERFAGDKKADRNKILSRLRLVDHLDAILSLVVPRVIDGALTFQRSGGGGAGGGSGGSGGGGTPVMTQANGGSETPQSAADATWPLVFPKSLGTRPSKWDREFKRDLLLLQAVYDRPDDAPERTRRLRALLGVGGPKGWFTWRVLSMLGWLAPAGFFVWGKWFAPPEIEPDLIKITTFFLAGLWGLVLVHRLLIERLALMRLARRLRRQIRVVSRPDSSYAASFRLLPRSLRASMLLPVGNSDEQRFGMVERVRSVLRRLNYAGMVVIIDRIDEPTLISGDPERMQSVVWPMLNNKFLQQDGIGVKMLLPIELRHALFRESSAFFQEARLDKQNMIERLAWTGAALYDLCNARLSACLLAHDSPARGPERPTGILDLFADDVTRQDLIETLEQMHQPRDAFKLLYQCLADHCAGVTEDQLNWKVPKSVLENTKKIHGERVRQLQRGVRPA